MSRLVFRRFGGSTQLQIKTFSDLELAIDVPEALWVATACPTTGLSCDRRFLEFVDHDDNKRIRPEELKAAVRWTRRMLRDTSGCDEASEVLHLDRLSEEGEALRKGAELVLEVLGADKGSISLAQLRDSVPVRRDAGVNGNGILVPAHLADPALASLATRLLEALPGVEGAGGRGIDAATLTAFREGRARGLARLAERPAAFVWGEASPERAAQLLAVAPRLDEYFLQGRLVAGQPNASPLLRLPSERVTGALGDREALSKAAHALPIAPPNDRGELVWSELVRGPSYEALLALRSEVIEPRLGPSPTLAESDYRALVAQAERVRAWHDEASHDKVVALGEHLGGIDEVALDTLASLIETDLARKPYLDALTEVEKLILYQRWLLTFANNFIAMPDLYSTKRNALFEKGRLILGGRLFTLAVHVPDRAAHVALAATNTMCLAYVKLERKGLTEPFDIVVPVTSGDSSGITVGKRGIFYDTENLEYDAVITEVVLQPVSLWEAMTQPFRRVGTVVSTKLQSFGQSGNKALDARLAASPTAAPAPAAPAPAPTVITTAAEPPGGALGGTVAAGGVAFAAIGSALAFIVNQLRSITLLDLIRAALSIALIVMVPLGVLGWLKLRQRNLAILLEGSTWALNDRLLLTKSLGRLFTRRPPRPRGSSIDYTDLIPTVEVGDEDEQEHGARNLVLTLVLVGLVVTGVWEFRTQLLQAARFLLPPPAASSAAPAASAPPAPPAK